ncbi:hypothetical protein KGQ34_01045 [Patescibacteria group bacterium]|nr:hypothetical protein [Patescibacteria group bacterium]
MAKPDYKMYVLFTSWSWDKHHDEFATFSFENINLDGKPVRSIEEVLETGNSEDKNYYSRILRNIADAQDGSTLGRIRLIRLYRVLGFDFNPDEPSKLNFELYPIYDFDDNDNMIPIDPGKYK